MKRLLVAVLIFLLTGCIGMKQLQRTGAGNAPSPWKVTNGVVAPVNDGWSVAIGTSALRDNAGTMQVSNGGGAYQNIGTATASISDVAYPTGWNTDTVNGASRNAIYDALQAFLPISQIGAAYDTEAELAALLASHPHQDVGTADNPSFASVHASGGNLAAANRQVVKAWQAGLPYVADLTAVVYGGTIYVCTSSHTAGSTTEPGVGASWETVWAVVSGTALTDLDDLPGDTVDDNLIDIGLVGGITAFGESLLDDDNATEALSTLGALPLAGGTMTGKVNFAASTASAAPVNLGVGTTPSTLVNGDMWIDSVGCRVRFAGSTYNMATTAYVASDISTHAGLADPHTVYMLESNIGFGANNYLRLSASPGTPDGTKFLRDDGVWAAPSGAAHDALTLGASLSSIFSLTGQVLGLTAWPTFNQNTTGTAAGLAAQYIDWNSASGGSSIANKPTIPDVSAYDTAEERQDEAGAMWTGNTETGIAITYQDVDGTIDAVVSISTGEVAAATLVTASETIGSNNNDTTLPTSAAVKAYADSVAGAPTNVTPVDAANENATFYLILADGATGSQATETDPGLSYNPSTNVLSSTGGFSVPQNAAGPQISLQYEDSDNGTNYVGWASPAANANDLVFLPPVSDPTAGQAMVFAVPSAVTFSDGVARDASQATWVTPQPADADLTTWAGITPGTGIGTWLATPTIGNWFSAVTGEGAFASTLLGYAGAPAVLAGIGAAPSANPIFTGSAQLPNGTNPTTDAAGEVAVDSSTGAGQGLRAYGAVAFTLPAYQTKCTTAVAVTDTSDWPVERFPYAVTIRAIHVYAQGGTSVVGGLDECTGTAGVCSSVTAVDSDITGTAGSEVNDDGTLTNGAIASGNRIMWHTTTANGTNTSLQVCFDYTVDQVN